MANPVDDGDLIERIRRNKTHFGLLFDLHHVALKKYALRRTGNYQFVETFRGRG